MLSGLRTALLAAGVFLFAGLFAVPARHANAQIVPGPEANPRFRAPVLFQGYEPIQTGNSGLSPSGRFLVVQDNRGLRVVRVVDGAEVFRDTLPANNTEVGFDPFDRRLFVVESERLTYRVRFVHPDTGQILLNATASEPPDIRVNAAATANVVILRRGSTAQVIVFNEAGRIVYRRNTSPFVKVGINDFAPVAALIDRRGSGSRVDIVVLNALTGRITLRESISERFDAGFEPFGTAFVVARATSVGSFRVRMVNGFTGRFLVNRTFFGPANAGFTDDSRLLGVKSRQGSGNRVYLFRTINGAIIAS